MLCEKTGGKNLPCLPPAVLQGGAGPRQGTLYLKGWGLAQAEHHPRQVGPEQGYLGGGWGSRNTCFRLELLFGYQKAESEETQFRAGHDVAPEKQSCYQNPGFL